MLRNFDQISFWLGFLAGTLFWLIAARVGPGIIKSFKKLVEQLQAARENLKTQAEIRFQFDLLKHVQKLHISSQLFSLDEIVITPHVLAPPRKPKSDDEYKAEDDHTENSEGKIAELPPDIVEATIPYTPDWPELLSAFNAPMLTLSEALSKGADLLIVGLPGIGKTTALAHLATQIIRQDPSSENINHLIPFYAHVEDILLPADENNILSPLIAALSVYTSRRSTKALPDMLKKAFTKGIAFLMIDGLDEIPPDEIDKISAYISEIKKNYPNNRYIIACGPEYFDGITTLRLYPLSMAGWNFNQKKMFVKKWGELWETFITPDLWEDNANENSSPNPVEPYFINRLLLSETSFESPLETTLKTWAAYAGDSIGPSNLQAIEAYIRRLTVNITDGIHAGSLLALQMAVNASPAPQENVAKKWIVGKETQTIPLSGDSTTSESSETQDSNSIEKNLLPTIKGQVFYELSDRGLLIPRNGNRIMFNHPIFAAYLVSQSTIRSVDLDNIYNQPHWSGKTLFLHYISTQVDISKVISQLLEEGEPLHRGPLMVGRWLKDVPEHLGWRPIALRKLVMMLQDETTALSTRAKAMTALVLSGDAGIGALSRKMMVSNNENLRTLSSLASGLLRDFKSINDLGGLIGDPSDKVRRASLLALVSISNKEAIDNVITALLDGDEELQRAAAEALSFHYDEGHEILKEASSVDNLLVRRAAVFGLARLRESWTSEILKKIAVEDGQWIVRNAAIQALDVQKTGPFLAPEQPVPLHEAPWLIEYAAKQGMGVSPGKPARDMLYRAIMHGNEYQKMSGMDRLKFGADPTIVPTLYNLYFGERGQMREIALITLWYLAATGLTLPDPIQYGLG